MRGLMRRSGRSGRLGCSPLPIQGAEPEIADEKEVAVCIDSSDTLQARVGNRTGIRDSGSSRVKSWRGIRTGASGSNARL